MSTLARRTGTQRAATRRTTTISAERADLLEALPNWLETTLQGTDLVAYRFGKALTWRTERGRIPQRHALDIVEARHAETLNAAAAWERDNGVVIGVA